MAKDPDQRFRSMDEVLAALKAASPVAPAPSGTQLPPPAPSASGAHALPNPTGSGPTFSPTAPAESGLKPIPAPLAAGNQSGSILAWQQRPPPKSSNRSLFVAVAVALVASVGALVGYFQMRGNASAEVASAVASASAAASANAAAAASAAAEAKPAQDLIVKVRISTDPDGATVKENGVPICSSTPCDVLYADADPNRVHTITVNLAGYRSETKGIRVGDSPIIVRLTSE